MAFFSSLFLDNLNNLGLTCLVKGCSNPKIPANLNLEAAAKAQYRGIVVHSSQFRSRYDDILSAVKPKDSSSDQETNTVLVVGGGKSAMEYVAFLACIKDCFTNNLFKAFAPNLPTKDEE